MRINLGPLGGIGKRDEAQTIKELVSVINGANEADPRPIIVSYNKREGSISLYANSDADKGASESAMTQAQNILRGSVWADAIDSYGLSFDHTRAEQLEGAGLIRTREYTPGYTIKHVASKSRLGGKMPTGAGHSEDLPRPGAVAQETAMASPLPDNGPTPGSLPAGNSGVRAPSLRR